MSLDIIVPVYNEISSIGELLDSFFKLEMDFNVIIVDDGSTDGTRDLLANQPFNGIVIHNPENKGKGFCIRVGLEQCKNKYTIIKDADLEQSVTDMNKLYEVQLEYPEKMIIGTRILSWNQGYDIRFTANLFFSSLISFRTKTNITDVMSGYKMMRTEYFKRLRLTANRFGIEPQIVREAIRNGIEILEVPIAYNPRTWKQGKKIKFADSFSVIKEILKP